MEMTRQGWERLAETARYDAKELAKLCHLSVRQLERDFRRDLGRTPQDWLNEQRIKTAQMLLLSGHLVKVVAMELGFKQVSHFCRQFKRQTQLTPTAFAGQKRADQFLWVAAEAPEPCFNFGLHFCHFAPVQSERCGSL